MSRWLDATQDKVGTVYTTPAGGIFLCLDPGDWLKPRPATMLNLQTGEVRVMYRDAGDLVRYGWRRLEP